MNKKTILLLDNSFMENYCYCSNEVGFSLQKWNSMLESISLHHSDFENDYSSPDINQCILESIGLGNLNNKLLVDKTTERIYHNCFPVASDFLISEKCITETPEKAVKILDALFTQTLENLSIFYKNNLDPMIIVNKVEVKLNKKLHPYVQVLNIKLKEWQNNIKEGKDNLIFQQLCRDLAWNALVKHDWYKQSKDPKYYEIKKSDKIFILPTLEEILKRLIVYYYNCIEENDYLIGAVLLNKYALIKKKDNKSQPYKQNRELLDPLLTEYACLGFYDYESKHRKQVIILTTDQKQETRIKNYIYGKKEIDKEFKDKGLLQRRNFIPGYIIVIDPKTDQVLKIIDVSKLI